jgi:membrane-anchored protein YejM (alkaline phosphatase superfamily)
MGDIYYVHGHVYYILGNIYCVHIYFNHFVVDIYRIHLHFYHVLGYLSIYTFTMSCSTVTVSMASYIMLIENCTVYMNTFSVCVDTFTMYEGTLCDPEHMGIDTSNTAMCCSKIITLSDNMLFPRDACGYKHIPNLKLKSNVDRGDA